MTTTTDTQTTTKPFTKTQEARYARLLKNGSPRYVRCYDNGGKTFDRYTVTFPRFAIRSTDKANPWTEYPYIDMSENPFAPMGFGQHGSSQAQIDRPTYSHLGKKIAFHTLPEDCQRAVLQDYADYWDLPLSRLLSDCLRPSK